MPPAGTKLPANRVRKPPSCDTCKQKRVLCHPSPTGCPRCVEKGLVCTTTPVVRRKPTKRKKFENESTAAPETASPSGSPRASTVDPVELPIPPTTSSHLDQSTQSSVYDPTAFNPIASTSSYVHDPIPTISSHPQDPVFIPNFDSFQLVSLNHAPTRLSVSPDLAQHFFRVFAQTPQHEHPLFVAYTLRKTLKLLNWQVDLLPTHSSVLAYCIFAVASLLSYHPSIIDPYYLNFGGVGPASFEDVLEDLPDLRKYGKLRHGACQAYRQEAIRRAKDSDILFVASEEAATACHLLYWLELVAPDGRYSTPSIWYAAMMSHIRVLDRTSSLPFGDMQTRWICYMLIDSIQALLNEQNPPTLADQLLLVGSSEFSEDLFDRETELPQSQEGKGWPNAAPHLILGLELSRKVHEDICAGWSRGDLPFDFAKTSSILNSLESRCRVGKRFAESINKYIKTFNLPAPVTQFPSLSSNDPTERIKMGEITAMRSYRTIIQISWTFLTLIVYQELRKRQLSWNPANQKNERYLKSRLDFCVDEARVIARKGLEETADAWNNLSALGIWTHSLRLGSQKWAEFMLSEIQEGLMTVDEKVVGLMDTLSQALKQTGYAWSNSTLDSLILSLDSHVAAFRLASNPSPPTSTSYPAASQFAQSTDSFDFDPSLSLFANLTAISTPSGSSNDYSPVENAGRPTSSQTGCAPGRESGGRNGLDELSQVLGLY